MLPRRFPALSLASLTLLACLYLPIASAGTAHILVGKRPFTVELALTPDEQSQGLMHRETLPADQGMLFIYEEPLVASFWMKNMLFPLDILFFDQERHLIHSADNVPPCKQSPCPNYRSPSPVLYILELNPGTRKKLQLEIGSTLNIID